VIDINILLVIALILFTTKILAIFTRRINMPQVVGALAAGIILGPAVLGVVEPNEAISVIAEFGVIVLLFSAGMETDFRQLRTSFKSSALIAVLGVSLALGGGFGIALLFGMPTFESFFIGVVIASTSTSITVEALNEMGKLKSKSGTSIMGAAIIDDILTIVILAVVLGMGAGNGGFSIASVGITLLKIALFFAFATLGGFAVKKLFDKMYAVMGQARRLSVFALAYCFLMAYLAELFGLADITGAYLAGIALCNTRCVEYLETKIHELSYILLTPVFLANIGIHASLDGMTGSVLLFTGLLVVMAVLSKVAGCGLGAKMCGYTNSESMQIGIGLIARGEVSIIIASKGISAGLLEPGRYSSVIIIVLVTVLITPLLLKRAYRQKPA